MLFRSKKKSSFIGSGTINITGYVLIPQRYYGSGSFSSFGGAAEVKGSNPPDQTVPIVISGAASNLKNTYSNFGSGTAVFSNGYSNLKSKISEVGSGSGTFSGTAAESFVPTTAIGSGSIFGFGTKIEKNTDSYNINSTGYTSEEVSYDDLGILSDTVVYDDFESISEYVAPEQYEENGETLFASTSTIILPYGTFVISGGYSNLKSKKSEVGSGTAVFFGTSNFRSKKSEVGSGRGTFSGTAAESFIPATAIGSGTLFAVGGSAEVSGSNPPDQTVPIVISGGYSNLKSKKSEEIGRAHV